MSAIGFRSRATRNSASAPKILLFICALTRRKPKETSGCRRPTISAALANEFTEAVGDLYTSSLFALGSILFIITFVVLAAAKLMLLRIEQRAAK